MPATTLKLSDELKARISNIAATKGKTPHAFMIEALEREARREELRQAFVEDALAAEQEMLETGSYYDGEDVLRYLENKLQGKPVRRPRARKL